MRNIRLAKIWKNALLSIFSIIAYNTNETTATELRLDGTTLNISINSSRQILFDSARNGCDADDIPDSSLRLFRRNDGQIIAFVSHFTTRIFRVESESRFIRDCAPVMRSGRNPDPAAFDDARWVSSIYTEDGVRVYALTHNEYHGHRWPGQCNFGNYSQCWFNTIGVSLSENGGQSFSAISNRTPIAAPAFDHQTYPGEPRGFFGATNPIRLDSHIYSIIFTTGGGNQRRGSCLFRTSSFGDPNAWQYLTETGFAPSARDPYRNVGAMNAPPCAPLALEGERVYGVVRHQPSGLFLATVGRRSTSLGPAGAYIVASRNLIRWSRPVLLLPGPMMWQRDCSTGALLANAVLADLASPDRNFGDIGSRLSVFSTEIIVRSSADGSACTGNQHRQVVRYEVTITSSE